MCIIIDMNTLPAVFDKGNKQHGQFAPIFNHIDCGKSKMIIGGSTYEKELYRISSIVKLLSELRRSQKLVVANKQTIDTLEKAIARKYPESKYPDFNDKHIVALAYATNARLVCTIDKPLQSYLKARAFYNKSKTRPVIFNEATKPSVMPQGSFKPKCSLCPKP